MTVTIVFSAKEDDDCQEKIVIVANVAAEHALRLPPAFCPASLILWRIPTSGGEHGPAS
jgi:hypothetical protein